MKINLIDINKELVKEWNYWFKDESTNIIEGSIFDHETECIVSPANSFGFMDGNLDYYISEHVGWDVQERLQSIIKENHNGELLVGNAELIATSHSKIRYIISAPTMRVPDIVSDTTNVYLASKAIFRTAIENNLKSISISGLGTGCGKVSPLVCAKQMYYAYREVIKNDHFISTPSLNSMIWYHNFLKKTDREKDIYILN